MSKANIMKDIVVIDLETSGVDLKTSEILGVSAVLLKSNKVTGLKYETWCNASQPMNKNALSLIGKKEAFFEDQPLTSNVIIALENFIKNAIVVANNPVFCSNFLYKAGLSQKIEIRDALDIVRANLKDYPPYDYEDFLWKDWLEGPLQRLAPCCDYLEDDFDSMVVGKLIEISFSHNLVSQLESVCSIDD